MPIVVFTRKDKHGVEIVSHGIDMDTLRHVTLQEVPVHQIGARFDPEIMEWVLGELWRE